jgi:hypothetical protein
MITPKRFFFGLLTTLALLGIVAGAIIYKGDALLVRSNAKLLDLKAESYELDQQERLLAQAKKDLEKYKELDTLAKLIVPQDKDQARAVREIVSIAEESGIRLLAVTFPSSNLGQQAPAKPATPIPGTTGTAPAPAPKPTTIPSQVLPVAGLSNVYVLSTTIVNDSGRPVPYNRFINFLARLEQNRRTAQVTKIAIAPDTTLPNHVNFTLSLNIYIKPATP